MTGLYGWIIFQQQRGADTELNDPINKNNNLLTLHAINLWPNIFSHHSFTSIGGEQDIELGREVIDRPYTNMLNIEENKRWEPMVFYTYINI